MAAVATLIYKRHTERPRRQWLVWFFDATKQAFAGAAVPARSRHTRAWGKPAPGKPRHLTTGFFAAPLPRLALPVPCSHDKTSLCFVPPHPQALPLQRNMPQHGCTASYRALEADGLQ